MTPQPPDRALLERIGVSLLADLRPVRPLPSAGTRIAVLFVLFAGISVAGAAILGFFGFQKLGANAIATIFPQLAALALLSAAASVSAMTPGSRRWLHPVSLAGVSCVLLGTLFVILFQDMRTDSFVHQGAGCLKAGLLWALPAAAAVWLVLRRGYAVDGGAAGVAMGVLAGLAGLTVLELHCPNFRMPHIVVWHLAVVPIAAFAGWMAAAISSARNATRRS